MSMVLPEDLLDDSAVREAHDKKEEARQYMLNFKCPSCAQTGSVRVLKLVRITEQAFGSCKNCNTVVWLDRRIMIDHLLGVPFNPRID